MPWPKVARARRLAADDLGSQELGGPQNHTGAGETSVTSGAERQSEVDQREGPVGAAQDVVRLEIPVQDAAPVALRQRREDLQAGSEGLLPGHGSIAQALRERGPGDELVGEPRWILVEIVVQEADDPGMEEGERGPGLAPEPLELVTISNHRGREQLDRRLPAELAVPAAQDDAEPALTYGLERLVLLGASGGQVHGAASYPSRGAPALRGR